MPRPSFIRNQQRALAAMKERQANFRKFVEQAKLIPVQILREGAKAIKERSQELVPVRTGELRASAFTTEGEERGVFSVAAGYSQNGEVPYAVYVHENMEAHHPHGQAKFLQQAGEELIPEIQAKLEAALRDLTSK